MRTAIALLLMLGFVVTASGLGTGCQQSTKEELDDDEVGPARSGPYMQDVQNVSAGIVAELKRQRVLEGFKRTNNEPPVVALIPAVNKTRFVEITDFFIVDLMGELRKNFTRDEIRFVKRDPEVLAAIEKEKGNKESGDLTDRTGRRTKLGADFFLRAEFYALSASDGKEEDDTIKYVYSFIDTENTEEIFSAQHNIRRVSDRKVIYR